MMAREASTSPFAKLLFWRRGGGFARLGDGWIYAGLCLFFAVMIVQHNAKVSHSNRSESQTAFLRWTPQVRELADGVNIWAEYNWPNTPMMALILKPYMDAEPIFIGSQAWLITKMICAVVSIFLVFRMLDRPAHPFPFWGKALTVILCLKPFEGDLIHGNVNLFILLTVVAACHALTKKWDIAAGLWLALGIACKITPALFLPYLVWKRAWKALTATCFGLILWSFLVPSLYFGWQRNVECLTSWINGMVLPYIVKNEITSEHQSQSLPSFLERILRHRPSMTQPTEDKAEYEALAYHNVVDLPKETLSRIVKGFMAAFCLVVMWRCRAPRSDRSDWRWVAEFGAIVIGMLIFNERTWKHHAVTLVIPFAVLMHQISAFRLPRGLHWYLAGTVVIVFCLMLTTISGVVKPFGVPDKDDVFGKYAQVYGVYLWSFFLLLAAMFTLSGRMTNDPVRGVPDSSSSPEHLRQAA